MYIRALPTWGSSLTATGGTLDRPLGQWDHLDPLPAEGGLISRRTWRNAWIG